MPELSLNRTESESFANAVTHILIMNQTRKVVSCAKEDALPEFPKRKDSPGRILVRPASRIRAVIVDDDENDRFLTGSVLARIPGVESVASFASAEEALNGVSASAVDIVLMDFQMPGMDGIECTRKLKARIPHLKILMLTGMCDSKSIYESQRAGADGYLTKPLCPTQLMAWITFSLERCRTFAGSEPKEREFRVLKAPRVSELGF